MPVVRREGERLDICARYRPYRVSEMVGLDAVKRSISKALTMGAGRPKAYLFHGERGCGKTTAARIIAMGLNCELGDTPEPCLSCKNCAMALRGSAFHIVELNMAQLNKKEDADDIVRGMALATMSGRNKVYIFDEAHLLTAAAQNLLLKNLEEPPPRTYIVICTTEPRKLLKTLRSRCEEYCFPLPDRQQIKALLGDVFRQEQDAAGWHMTNEDKSSFLEITQGMAFREVLKAIEQAVRGGLSAVGVGSEEAEKQYIDVCRAVLNGGFPEVCETLGGLENVDWEGLRLVLLSYMKSVLLRHGLSGKGRQAAAAMEHLLTPLHFGDRESEARMVLALARACESFIGA